MLKNLLLMLLLPAVCLAAGCGGGTPKNTQAAAGRKTPAKTVPADMAADREALIAAYPGLFTQETYTDGQTGLSIAWNLFLPEGYDPSGSYPLVVFIADSSCAGKDPSASLTQGRGGLVWAAKEWQAVHPSIVAVPAYPVTILDDHDGYTTTEYVELTKRFIDYVSGKYAVDKKRIYGTGQSMGCMTTLILASEYPDLYAACMFVDGQWDTEALRGLEKQTFVCFAAEDDERAWQGARELMKQFDGDGVSYAYGQWDGNLRPEGLTDETGKLFGDKNKRYFISWKAGTVEPKAMPSRQDSADGVPAPGPGGDRKPGDEGMKSGSYHMASFDYAYNCVAVMEWLFAQSK